MGRGLGLRQPESRAGALADALADALKRVAGGPVRQPQLGCRAVRPCGEGEVAYASVVPRLRAGREILEGRKRTPTPRHS